MIGFRLADPSDPDLALVPETGPVAVIVCEKTGTEGDYDAKWGEFDNSYSVYRCKLIIRTTTTCYVGVRCGKSTEGEINATQPGQTYVCNLNEVINIGNAEVKLAVHYSGHKYEVRIGDLWYRLEGSVQIRNLLSGQ